MRHSWQDFCAMFLEYKHKFGMKREAGKQMKMMVQS